MSISPEWSGIFNTHSWLKMVPLVQSNMKIYPCHSLAMTGQDSELSQKAVVVGCLIFILSIGHGMAIVPYNATRSSHSSWTLAQSRLKYLLYVPQITHSILASPGTACPHMFNRELAIDIRFLQELPLLFTSTPSLPEAFVPAFVVQHLRHQGIHDCLLEITKKITLPKLYWVSFSDLK